MMWRRTIALAMVGLSSLAISAQDAPEPLLAIPYAFVDSQENLFIAQSGGALQVTQAGEAYEDILELKWSPDGQILAFLHYRSFDEAGAQINRMDLRVAPKDGTTPAISLVEGISSFPQIAWTADGRILYANDNEANFNASTPDAFKVDFYSISPTGGDAQLIGTGQFGVGCGGGADVPTIVLLNQEAGFMGNPLFLEQLSDGRIVYSRDCSGVGLNVFNPSTGTSESLDETLGRVQLSPNRTLLAAARFNAQDYTAPRTLVVHDLSNKTEREYVTRRGVDYIGWSVDESQLYYSSSAETGDLTNTDETIRILQAQGYQTDSVDYTFKSSAVFLSRLNLSDGTEAELYNAEGYSIQRIQRVGNDLFYSQIPTLRDWARAILEGSLDPLNFDQNPLDFIPVAVLLQNSTTAEVELLGLGINQIALPHVKIKRLS